MFNHWNDNLWNPMQIWKKRADERFLFKHIMPKRSAYTYRFNFTYLDKDLIMLVKRIPYTKRSLSWDFYVSEITINHLITEYFN